METNSILNFILDTDSYKFSHWMQYPPHTTNMFSYLESRGGKYDKTLFFGLQYYLKKYLSKRVTRQDVIEAAEFAKLHGVPFNEEGWMYIANELGGKIPVRIKAVPEGSIIPTSNILLSVEATSRKCFWVVSWIETLLVRLWYPITVATVSMNCKKIIRKYLEETADDLEGLDFKLHDFGSRGVSSQESAMIGGAAHLVNFMGSDTIAGIWMANKYYNSDMAGFSIPASEHSTMTMWGKDHEAEAYANMLVKYSDQAMFACVSDSYDIYNAAENIWGNEIKYLVDQYRGTVVIRPDSGDPPVVVCNLLRILDRKFGSTYNRKGYLVLNKVRVIQGDGINQESMEQILEAVKTAGFSTTNVNFGMGGALLQQMNRDTQKFAFKCSSANVGGSTVAVHKDPVTDLGKKSKKGRLDLALMSNNQVLTVLEGGSDTSLLRIVYENGNILVEDTLDQIRERAKTEYAQYRGWTDKGI